MFKKLNDKQRKNVKRSSLNLSKRRSVWKRSKKPKKKSKNALQKLLQRHPSLKASLAEL